MNRINRSNLTILIGTLLIGGFLGWIIKPSNHETIGSSDHQTVESSDHQHSETWTCSMHPQVRQPEPGQCPICGMDLIPAASKSAGSSNDPMVFEMSNNAVALANIATSRVKEGFSKGELLLSGKVKPDEGNISSITAKFPGRIEKLFINFTGQAISRGEKLATVYSPELVNAQRELKEAAASKADFPEIYAAAKEKLRLWKLTNEQIRNIENQEEILEHFEVLAEQTGIVSQRNVAVGDYIGTGSVLFEVVDLSSVWIMLDAYETDLSAISKGNALSFTVAGIPGEVFEAKVAYIDPILDPQTRTVKIRAVANNAKGLLRPEMFVNAKITTSGQGDQASVPIPRTALLWSGRRSVVYVKVPNAEYPAYEMREVTVGSRVGDVYPVLEGLKAGEEIVTNGVFAIDAAAQLAGNYSMMSRPESKTMEVSQDFRKQLTALAEAYFDLKNELVADDAPGAREAGKQVTAALNKVDMSLVEGAAHDQWMELKKEIEEALQGMQEAENIESVRKQFMWLSESMLEITESFGLEKDKVYRQYCPMAFGDEGAYWLSEKEEIFNPYFGESMLRCGEVRETYQKGEAVMQDKSDSGSRDMAGHNH
ncbi:efflux RND transporter periplasmic adaptor subunit [Cyclobacterium plantarum]|uniref:Efflux RND transporter periplasmic adaptor subunit n=1 Tax=Cyclobacterium plantarum TaxID=2716263 RepID=A0ABX0H9W7_9BACT|nr:efflux RND transporter periplasmic adaptor subunit [Cyclobacterium plantarum]NHE57139.1 efflux RND transporter periplasmic adaptor subunit [Cyclobacterium plantarum]